MADYLPSSCSKPIEMAEKKQNTAEGKKPVDPEKQIKQLHKELEAARKEAAEATEKLGTAEKEAEEAKAALAACQDKHLRLLAEFDTFRRRSAEEKLALVGSAAADTVKGMLPVLDDCESALKLLADADPAAREGTTLIYNKLMDYLKTLGLTPVEALGQPFDTDFHEALTQVPAPSEDMKGKVVDVYQTGYLLNGKVLRYAKVVVGA